MADFCVETIDCEQSLRPEHGILRVASLAVTSDARSAADRIAQEARAEADALLKQAQEQAQDEVRRAEQQTLERAAQLLQTLEQAHARLLQRSRDIVISVAQGLFERLVMDTTPRERVDAAIKRLLQEAQPGLANAVLRLHPDDIPLAPEVEWEVKPDAGLARGTCRLEASNGEWSADFAAAVSSLKTALDGAALGAHANANEEQQDQSDETDHTSPRSCS